MRLVNCHTIDLSKTVLMTNEASSHWCKQQISKQIFKHESKIFIQIIYKRQRLQKHRKLFKTENRRNNHRIYKIRRKKILNQEGRNWPLQEKGHRRHTKHINNFSELLLTNIRRSTSYNIQSSTSINHQKLLIFIRTSIKFNNNKEMWFYYYFKIHLQIKKNFYYHLKTICISLLFNIFIFEKTTNFEKQRAEMKNK